MSSDGGGDDPEAPLLPATSSEAELREAVGAEYPLFTPVTEEPSYAAPASAPAAPPPPPPRPASIDRAAADRDDDPAVPRRNRRSALVAAAALAVGIGIAALIFLGRANADRLALECQPEQVVAQQGRAFPPWGMHELGGSEWKPIAIPPEAECKPFETESSDELTTHFLAVLEEQASTLLTAREVTKVDLAEQQLKQALLLARSPDKRDQRKEIERLLGDVDYWRALAALRDATARLTEAAKQFDAAAARRPRHVTDASAWAMYIRKVADELHVGPAGAHSSVFPPSPATASQPAQFERPTAPVGSALPVEPAAGSAAPPVAPPDAGVPTGGVLL